MPQVGLEKTRDESLSPFALRDIDLSIPRGMFIPKTVLTLPKELSFVSWEGLVLENQPF